jgi:hypothetical protein
VFVALFRKWLGIVINIVAQLEFKLAPIEQASQRFSVAAAWAFALVWQF